MDGKEQSNNNMEGVPNCSSRIVNDNRQQGYTDSVDEMDQGVLGSFAFEMYVLSCKEMRV